MWRHVVACVVGKAKYRVWPLKQLFALRISVAKNYLVNLNESESDSAKFYGQSLTS